MRTVPTIKVLKNRLIDKGRGNTSIDKLEVHLTIYLTKIFLYTPLKPLQIMFLWFILEIISCGVIIHGGYFNVFFGVLLYQLSAILDNVDGQVARFYGNESILALYLDQLYHWINYPLLFLALGYATGAFWLGIANAVIFLYNKLFVFNPSIYNLKNERVEAVLHKIYWSRQREGEKTKLAKIYDLFRIPVLFNVLFFGAVFNVVKITLYLYLIMFVAEFFRKFIYSIRQFKKVDQELYGDKNTKK